MKRIYHILNDEKFSDWVIDSFENIDPVINKFILVSDHCQSKFLDNSKVKIINKDYFLYNLIPKSNDIFIFYYLHLHTINFLIKYKSLNYKKIWVGYGSDYYYYLLHSPYFPVLYKPITKNLFFNPSGISLIKSKVLNLYQIFFYYLKVKRAISSLDYFSSIIPQEYALIKKYYSFHKLKYLDFTFGDIEYLCVDSNFPSLDKKILVNNSATHAGNHFDVFQILKECNVEYNLLVPLSYGNKQYKEFLIHHCLDNFRDRCELLTDFIPRHEYSRKLNSCGFAIMGHVRQQAMGTIYAMLFQGSKLFLYEDNPVYSFLKEMDFIVFSLDQLQEKPELLSFLLSLEEKVHNRKILLRHYSKKSSLDRIQKICQL